MFFGLFDGNKKKKEFAHWLKAGAQLSHPELLGAFAGQCGPKYKAVSVVRMGALSVRSGLLAAIDPGELFEGAKLESFEQKIANGAHPCDALIVETAHDKRLAAVRLSFASGVVEALEPAWLQSSRAKLESRAELPAISVDSALAALLTPEAAEVLRAEVADPGDIAPGADDALWQETKFSNDTNMLVVSAGLGDGTYNCFFGKTTTGARTAFFLDFGFFGQPEKTYSQSKFTG